MPDQQDADREPERDETPAQRIDRNWGELLQELRVTQTGIQILFAFLLMLPFQPRFDTLDTFGRGLYVGVVGFVTLATVLNMAPVITHRLMFGKHRKDVLLRTSDRAAKLSFLMLGFALVGAVGLVADVVFSREVALWVCAGLALVIVTLWFLLPTVLLIRSRGRAPTY